ncbi:MAG: hypothetical protein HY326_05355 [Chloroflexi bacterium]|nr:hypothetical protein [Chloroflexota bacterium]
MPAQNKRQTSKISLLYVVIPLALIFSMLCGVQAFAAFLDLRNDNGENGYIGTDFRENFMAASILQGPADFYPIEVRGVKFVLGRPTGYDSMVQVRTHLYSVGADNRPAVLLASSDTITVTFAPDKNTDEELALLRPIITITTPRPFAVVLEYKSGKEYQTPGLVTDTQQNIPRGKNFYSRDGGANWIEHYDYWRKQPPGLIGYNCLWAWIETRVIISESSPTPTLPVIPTFTPTATATPFPTATPTATETPTPTATATPFFHSLQVFFPHLSAIRLQPPDRPTLLEIDNRDEDNNYEVHYLSGPGYLTYFLQEATEASFSSPLTFQINNETTYRAINRPPGTYYYRVYAINIAGRSPMSAVQVVTVPPPTTLWVIDNQTGYPLYIDIDGGPPVEVPREQSEWRVPSGIRQIHAQSHCGENNLTINFLPYAITSTYIFRCGPL